MAAFQCALWNSWAHTGFHSCGLCSVARPSRGVLSQDRDTVNPQTEIGGVACDCFLVLLSLGRQSNPLYSGTADNPGSKKVVENVDGNVVGPVTELRIVRNNSALFLSAWIECGWLNVWSGKIESARETFRAGKTDVAGTAYAFLVECYVDHRCSLDACHPKYVLPHIDTLLDWARLAVNNERHPEECVICLSSLYDFEERIWLPCGHSFHTCCIQSSFLNRTTCPMCRFDVAGYLEGDCLCAANGSSEPCKLAWRLVGWQCPWLRWA